MMIRFCGLALGLCLVMSAGLRAQDSLMLQIEAALKAPEPVTPEEEYYKQVYPKSLDFKSPFPAMGRFAFSFNYGGVANFGPMLHAEVGLSPQLRLDTHIRFLRVGFFYAVYQSYIESEIQSTPPAPGLGLVYCSTGLERHRPYISLMIEYDYHSSYRCEYWISDDDWQYWTYHLGIVGIGGGIRFRFPKGFFLNVGGYVFYGGGKEWYRREIIGDYEGDWSPRPYWMKHPWLQVDTRVGIEIRSRKK